VLTSWNGLMIGTFAQAAQVLDSATYATAAARAADFLLRTMRAPDGCLYHTWTAGQAPKLNGYLDDYANLVDALVSVYETTFEPRWLEAALELAGVMIEQFWDEADGGFFYTGRKHESLLARTRDPHDNATPSGNAMAVMALLRLGRLTGRADLSDKAMATLRLFRGLMKTAPAAAGQMLIDLDFHLGPIQEFAILGDLAEPQTQRVLRAVGRDFRPRKVVVWKPSSGPVEPLEALLPLLRGKTPRAEVTTYFCQDGSCQAPWLGAAAVEAALRKGEPSAG
jgi:hypothetical protein